MGSKGSAEVMGESKPGAAEGKSHGNGSGTGGGGGSAAAFAKSHVVLAPYNYIVSPDIRESLGASGC